MFYRLGPVAQRAVSRTASKSSVYDTLVAGWNPARASIIERNSMNRRNFLKLAGIGIAAPALPICEAKPGKPWMEGRFLETETFIAGEDVLHGMAVRKSDRAKVVLLYKTNRPDRCIGVATKSCKKGEPVVVYMIRSRTHKHRKA